MARLTGDVRTSNTILLDVEGTPSYDLPDTSEDEGDEIAGVKELSMRPLPRQLTPVFGTEAKTNLWKSCGFEEPSERPYRSP